MGKIKRLVSYRELKSLRPQIKPTSNDERCPLNIEIVFWNISQTALLKDKRQSGVIYYA
jgi:hypothetical protein